MAIVPKPYVKTLEDELDWKLLDQLHSVVSQISSFCFEIKKYCVTTEFVVLSLLAKFTADKLDNSLFIAGLLIPLCFWFLDAVGYYYQVKLRGTMENIRQRIASRDYQQLIDVNGEQVILLERSHRSLFRRILDSYVNHSMWLYVFMITTDIVVWRLFIARSIS